MSASTRRTAADQRGFTLVEAIIAMVITSILAGIMVLFIRQPVQNYVDAAGRAELGDVADLALRRMARELHGALPNSMRVVQNGNVWLLEFIPTRSGGSYLSAEDNNGTPYLDFQTGGLSFTVVSGLPAFPYAIVPGSDYIVVYNLGEGFQDADAYAGSNRAPVASLGAGNTVNLSTNPFDDAFLAGRTPNTSPTQRFNVVGKPVTFRCGPNAAGAMELTRYWDYGFNPAQQDPLGLGGSSAVLAGNVVACAFAYTAAANVHNGLVGLTIQLGRASSAETVTLVSQVNVSNTP